jgi:hypothetical protein
MNDDPHRLRNPLHALVVEAWRVHDERDQLEELQREQDVDGSPRWQERWDMDEGDADWRAYMLRPADPTDLRPPRRIGRWPVSFLERQLEEWRARCTEHDAE